MEHQRNAHGLLGQMIAQLLDRYVSDFQRGEGIIPDNHYQIGYRMSLLHVIRDLKNIIKTVKEAEEADNQS